APNRDLTVVGDDDQSLYRFRGATVGALVDFDIVCQARFKIKPTPIYLKENRRSHPKIVAWVNRFIDNHPEMKDLKVRVRAPGKPKLQAKSGIGGEYPAVMAIARRTAPIAAPIMAQTILSLKNDKLVKGYSQIAILTFSTKETSQAIGTYTAALQAANIPYSN